MMESAALNSPAPAALPRLAFTRIARQGSFAMAIRLADAGAAFLLQVCTARLLGQFGYGSYAYAFAWLQLGLVFSHGGFGTAALRYLAVYRARREMSLVHGFLRRSFQISLIEAIALGVAMAGVVLAVNHRLSEYGVANLLIVAISIPVFSQFFVCRVAIRGLGHTISSMTLDLFQQLLLLAALLAAALVLQGSFSPTSALLINLGSAVVALALTYAMQCRYQYNLGSGQQFEFRTREWLGTATQMMFMQGLIYVQGRTGIIVTGLLLDDRAAGTYAAMERLADVALLGVSAVNFLVAPTFAALYAQGRRYEIQRYARLAAWASTGFMLVSVLPLVFFGRTVVQLFGEGFVVGYPVLLVLLAGVSVSAVCGSACTLLVMTGHQRETMRIAFGSLCVNLILLLVLVPRFGINGTSVAFAISNAISSMLMLVFVRRRIGIWCCPGDIR